jgi:hypothetical protein
MKPTGLLLQQSWREMAETKTRALDLEIMRAQQSKARLKMFSQCHCRDIEECSQRIATLQRTQGAEPCRS